MDLWVLGMSDHKVNKETIQPKHYMVLHTLSSRDKTVRQIETLPFTSIATPVSGEAKQGFVFLMS